VSVCVGESNRGTHGLTGIARSEGTPVPAARVSGAVCATPPALCECSGSGSSRNIRKHPGMAHLINAYLFKDQRKPI